MGDADASQRERLGRGHLRTPRVSKKPLADRQYFRTGFIRVPEPDHFRNDCACEIRTSGTRICGEESVRYVFGRSRRDLDSQVFYLRGVCCR
jgi:hypothetical protein